MLKNIFSQLTTHQEKQQETFLALEISSAVIKSAVWTVESERSNVLKTGSIEGWEEEDKNSLINAVDTSISNASRGIKPEPNKIIFGLPESWIKGKEIKEEKKALLKDLCRKLALKPLGFVVTLEALIAFLKEKEGTPVSAIFITLTEAQITVSFVHLGKIKESKIVGRSDDLAADTREALARFNKVESFPARMILYNGIADFEEAKQQLISFDWQKQLPFLHFPKVESLAVLSPIKAIAIAGGAEVAKSLGFKIKETKEKKEEKKEPKTKEKKEPTPPAITERIPLINEEKVTAADLGFISNQDIIKIKKSEGENVDGKKEAIVEIPSKQKSIKLEKLAPFLSRLIIVFKKMPFRLFKLRFKKISSLIILPFIFFFLFILGGLAFYWYVPKALVVLYLKPKTLNTKVEFTLNSKTEKREKEIIPCQLKTITVEGEKNKKTTGEKLVGEKAKGKIVIYNKTDVAKTFPKETVLIGPDKLAFSLDEEIKIASQSSSIDENEVTIITPGQTNSNITAKSIGTESNLPQGAKLTLKGYSSSLFLAKAENAFSGGTSRQIQAVDKEDLAVLLKDLTAELQSQAKEKIKKQTSIENDILDKIAKEEILSKKFSAAEDEEVDNLNLQLKERFDFFIYKKNDFEQFTKEIMAEKIANGYVFNYGTSQIDIQSALFKNDQAKIKGVIKLNLLPQLETEEIKKNIQGRYPAMIQEYFGSLPNFSRADIKITPTLPPKLRTLPRIAKNITIEIKVEE